MNKKNLGQLPIEIIQAILTCLLDNFSAKAPSLLEYQLINTRWYLASLNVMYRTLELGKNIDQYENFSKMGSFLILLRNPTNNIGQYTKEIYLYTENLMI